MDAQERKIEEQENKIQQIREKADHASDYTQTLSQIKTGVERLHMSLQKTSFPEREVRQLCAILETSIELLRKPVKKEIMHRHHATKTIWIAAALFLVVCLMSAGWYNTYDKLEMYKANDTKYRYLKLDASVPLHRRLGIIDSLYIADNKMRTTVIAREEQNQRNFETDAKSCGNGKRSKGTKGKSKGRKG